MKNSLQMKIGQQLAMTPQLQQAIKLLQLSTLELQTEIQQALESNPMLEVQEESDDSSEKEAAKMRNDNERESNKQEAEAEAESKKESDEDFSADDISVESLEDFADSVEITEATPDIPDELPVDSAWEDIYEPAYGTGSMQSGEESQRDFTEYTSAGGGNLQDHLLEQLQLRSLTESDQVIATTVINCIDDNGYLEDSVEVILEAVNENFADPEDHCTEEEVEAILRLIQQLDPIGCGSRDTRECMLIQLQEMDESPHIEVCKQLIGEHLQMLAARDFAKIKRQLKINEDQLQRSIQTIQSLTPRPGSQVVSNKPQYIVPDVFVKKIKGVWRVELNPDIAPRLAVNSMYAGLVKRADKSDDNNYMRNQLQEARWFIKSLQSRNETLLRVGTAIVERQRGFLEYGDEAMRPLVLRDIAEHLDLHESTISRVTTQKYIHTPRGIFEFKYFFSSHVSTSDGGECSATAIRAMIRKFIAKEDPGKPLSDSKIASTLVASGIQVARRTVAKYRESMSIPPSNERKRLT
jgi:RNA polymerase sigma-54 factor